MKEVGDSQCVLCGAVIAQAYDHVHRLRDGHNIFCQVANACISILYATAQRLASGSFERESLLFCEMVSLSNMVCFFTGTHAARDPVVFTSYKKLGNSRGSSASEFRYVASRGEYQMTLEMCSGTNLIHASGTSRFLFQLAFHCGPGPGWFSASLSKLFFFFLSFFLI